MKCASDKKPTRISFECSYQRNSIPEAIRFSLVREFIIRFNYVVDEASYLCNQLLWQSSMPMLLLLLLLLYLFAILNNQLYLYIFFIILIFFTCEKDLPLKRLLRCKKARFINWTKSNALHVMQPTIIATKINFLILLCKRLNEIVLWVDSWWRILFC